MAVEALIKVLERVPDPRDPQGIRYEWIGVLMQVCAAMLCGYDNPNQIAIWGSSQSKEFLRLLGYQRGESPKKSQMYGLLAAIDILYLEQLISEWVESVLQEIGEAPLQGIAIDGKTTRGSQKQGAAITHLLSGVSHGVGLTLYQIGVPDKTNEIPMTQHLLAGLLIEGRVMTMDALLTQREIAQTIVERDSDYLMVVKDNQPTLKASIAEGCEQVEQLNSVTTFDHGHGRFEERTLSVTPCSPDTIDWPGCHQMGLIERWRFEASTGKLLSHETDYFITSLLQQTANPFQLLKLNREHWTIENKSHYVRDTTFNEDACRVHNHNLPQVLACFRNLSLSILRRAGMTATQTAFIKNAAQPFNALGLLIL